MHILPVIWEFQDTSIVNTKLWVLRLSNFFIDEDITYIQVATGEVDMALGTDTGGSIRMPSCWCGVVGLKPTYGLVPFTGIMALDKCLDHVGPIARTVHDCALLLEV